MIYRLLPALALVLCVGCATKPAPAPVLTATATPGAADPTLRYDLAAPQTLPARLDVPVTRRGGYLLVPGYVDGESIGTMMIDTGASLSVIAQGRAATLGLETDGEGKTVGVGGVEAFDYFKAEDYAIGNLSEGEGGWVKINSSKMAGLSLLRFGRALGVSLGGIVSFTDLDDVPFALDATRKQLTLYNPRSFRPPSGATRERLHRYRKLPMVRAELNDGQQRIEVWLIIDYGADNALTLPDTLLQQYPGVVSVNAAGTGRTRGIGGAVSSTQTWVRSFRVFDLDLQDVPVNFETPPPTMGGKRAIGRIGNTLLQHFRLTFHAQHGWVYAEWNPEAPPEE